MRKFVLRNATRNVPNECVHRAGPPFLDNHYRGYQLCPLQQHSFILYIITCEIRKTKSQSKYPFPGSRYGKGPAHPEAGLHPS